jgi:hypothetical protein
MQNKKLTNITKVECVIYNATRALNITQEKQAENSAYSTWNTYKTLQITEDKLVSLLIF